MGSTTEITISITMILLFSIAIMGFSIGFANDTDADISISDNADALTVYNSQLTKAGDLKDNSEDTYTSILDTTVEPGSDVVPSAAPFALTSGSLIDATKNIVTLPVKYIFGGYGSPFGIFFTMFIAVIVLLLILYSYKTLRGNP